MTTREILTPSSVPPPGGCFSLGLRTETLVFTAGQIGTDQRTGKLATTFEAQVCAAVRNVESVLREGGSGLDRVIKMTCFLSDTSRFNEFDRLYGELMPRPYPPRSTVGVSFAGNGEILVEIEAIASRVAADNA